jgi:hypothetical protein
LRAHPEPGPRLSGISTKDAQAELVRRYARILRGAPAEASRAWSPGGPHSGPPRFSRETPPAPAPAPPD